MSFNFSVDAQEFVPSLPSSASSKPQLCTSLSVDAAVFVPVVINENKRLERKYSTPQTSSKNVGHSPVQRRGRFAQVDCRGQVKKKPFDCFKKGGPPTSTAAPDGIKFISNVGFNKNKKSVPNKELKGPNKELKVLNKELTECKTFTPFCLDEDEKPPQKNEFNNKGGNESKNCDIDIPHDRKPPNSHNKPPNSNNKPPNFSNKPPNFGNKPPSSTNSQESKPIVLWSSVVKKESLNSNEEVRSASAPAEEKQADPKVIPNKELKQPNKELKQPNKELKQPNKELRQANKELKQPTKEIQNFSDELKLTTTNKKNSAVSSNKDFKAPNKELVDPKLIPNKELKQPNKEFKSAKNNQKAKVTEKNNMQNSQKQLKLPGSEKEFMIRNKDLEVVSKETQITADNKVVIDEKNKSKSYSSEVTFNVSEKSSKSQKLLPIGRKSEKKGLDMQKDSKKGPEKNVRIAANQRSTNEEGKVNFEKSLSQMEDYELFPKKENIESLNFCDSSSFPALTERKTVSVDSRLSYSAITKRSGPPVKPVATTTATVTKYENSEDSFDIKDLTEDEKRIRKKRLKKEKRKMKVKMRKEEAKASINDDDDDDDDGDVITRNRVIKKKSAPAPLKPSERDVTLDLSDLFTNLLKDSAEKRKQKAKIKKSTGIISVVPGLAKKNTPGGKKVERNRLGTAGTVMDGSTPIKKRGKERETPKKKRPTLLKKVITAEREKKRQGKIISVDESAAAEGGEGVSKAVNDTCVEGENSTTTTTTTVNKIVENISGYPETVWKKIHSKKFREYCDHVLSKEINQLTYNLLVTLQKFQDRVYHENPTKYKQKRRFILGLREVLKHLQLKRLKAVIIAPNIERIMAKGGLDDYLSSIISNCDEQEVPKIFAMNRHVLGRIIKKLAPVSVVGIFNYDGAHEIFKDLMTHVDSAKVEYKKKVSDMVNNLNSSFEGGVIINNLNSSFEGGVVVMNSSSSDENNRTNDKDNKSSNGGQEAEIVGGMKADNQKILSRTRNFSDIKKQSYVAVDSESDAWVTDNDS